MAFTDDFNRADENLEANANWTHDGLIAGALAIRTNNLSCLTTNATGSAYQCPDQGSADHYVQFRVRNTSDSGPFVCCRLADRSNFVGIRNLGGTLEVYRRVGGTLSSLHASAQSIIAGDVLRLECEGTNWRAYKNGVQFAGAAGGGAIGSGTLTSQRQGLVGRTTTQNPWIDDFEAGALGSTSINGTLNQTIDSVTLAASGDLDIKGSLAQSVGEVTQAASGDLLIAGTFGAAIAPVTQSAAGAVIIQGSFGQTVGAVTLDAVGSAELPTTNGTFNVIIDNVVLAASGRGPSQRGDDAAPRRRLPAYVPEIREEEPEKPVVKRKVTKQVVAKAIETIPEIPEWWAPKTVKAILPPFIEVPKSRDAEAAFYAEIRAILARKAQEEADDEEETILMLLAA